MNHELDGRDDCVDTVVLTKNKDHFTTDNTPSAYLIDDETTKNKAQDLATC